MSAPRRFGVLGTGYWARWCHGAALAAHPDVELVGFWGRDRAKADAAAAEAGGRGFADLDELLAAVDAVSIALPPDVQAPLAVRAARAGRHLLLEKPVALELAAADAVLAATREAGVASVVNVTYLFQPDITDWLDRLRELAVRHGPWEGALVRWGGSIDAPGSPFRDSPWRREHGGLWDAGPHALSVLGALLPPVERVTAARGVRDAVTVLAEHAGGASTAMSLTGTAPPGIGGPSAIVWGPGGRHEMPWFTGTPQEGFARAVDDLRAAALSGREHPAGAADGRDTVAVLSAVAGHLARPLAERATTVPR
ncbi:Gfo/Idh/MocA family protein [Kineococcus rubinsiae]|uniref:Gfo/Idh/MocA family protein n=1 Tax=Kineococcus rubinsiae TaxID=2609562 RepID=UPI00143032C1|nr:Gfo/Idh/MocA family oxidoreductase [Kineococcus rubinsiae]NIZ91309.1 Gfo/Idh/MocA family oxidoreductase [Kineococcus rubinsiae]